MRKTRAKFGDAKLCHEKIAELITLRRQRRRNAGLRGLREEIWVEFLDGAGRERIAQQAGRQRAWHERDHGQDSARTGHA